MLGPSANDDTLETATRIDDRSLCERVLQGDSQAFEQLVARHQDQVFKLVRGILGDWHRSEDVCQEVFATLYRKLGAFRHESSLGTWIYRVAVNAALKARKKDSGVRKWLSKLAEERAATSRRGLGRQDRSTTNSEGTHTFESSEAFEKLVRPLPESLRSAVVLREAGGLSYDEIAEVLGCTRGAVEQRLHRALLLLREIWKEKLESS